MSNHSSDPPLDDEQLFAAALALSDETEVNALIERECAGRPDVCAKVHELLEAHRNPDAFLSPTLHRGQQLLGDRETDPLDGHTKVGMGAEPPTIPALETCDTPGRLGTLGIYEVIALIGSGGMGLVLSAWDTKLHRMVALKLVSQHVSDHPAAAKRFLREARTAVLVKHQNIIEVYAVEDDRRPPLLVMEYVEGETLQQRLDREGSLPTAEIVRIGLQMAQGLAAAHSQGLIHRDVKPSNVLIDGETGHIKLADFGLARAMDDTELTQSGMILGTPQYMSPEQARGDTVDSRSDLFSLGSVLYALCTGKPAFPSTTTVGAAYQICNESPKPICQLNAAIPLWLEAIVARLQARDRDNRFRTADELVDALHAGESAFDISAGKSKTLPRIVGALAAFLCVLVIAFTGMKRSTNVPYALAQQADEPAQFVFPPGESPTEILSSPDWQWTEPVQLRLPGLPEGTDVTGPTLSDDKLTLMFGAYLPGVPHYLLHQCTRDTIDDSFRPAIMLGEGFNTSGMNMHPSFAPGGLRLVFASDRREGYKNNCSVWMSTRSTLEEPFTEVEQVDFLDQKELVRGTPYLTSDGLTLYYSTRDPEPPGLWKASRATTSEAFGNDVRLGQLFETDRVIMSPCLTADECTLFFTALGPKEGDSATLQASQFLASIGLMKPGKLNLWMSHRASKAEQFGPAVSLDAPISLSGYHDRAPCISADGKTLIFDSNRDEGKRQLWISHRVLRAQAKGSPKE